MARANAFAVLRLPHHGGTGNLLCLAHGCGWLSAVAGKIVCHTLDSLAANAQLSLAVHREYCRLDDRRDRPPAVAGVRADSHRPGLFQICLCRKWAVHSAWIYGNLQRALDSFHCADLSNYRERARSDYGDVSRGTDHRG